MHGTEINDFIGIFPQLAQVPLRPVPELEMPTLHHRYFIEDLRQRYENQQ